MHAMAPGETVTTRSGSGARKRRILPVRRAHLEELMSGMNRQAIRRVIGAASAALAALMLIAGVVVMSDPVDTTPSAVKKLYDPTDL